jgi:Raf kinase inhibitor-like YbhB/YbcL family protein
MPYETTEVRAPQAPRSDTRLRVTSETFTDGGTLPRETAFTGCGGDNRSPQLAWSGFPPETRSFVVTCFDPDAPTGSGFWHWLLFNVPPSVTRLAAGESEPAGSTTGRNDYGASAYGGPCPPGGDGPHRYNFTVHALDVPSLDGIDEGVGGARLAFTMRGHVLATGTLTGHFGMP